MDAKSEILKININKLIFDPDNPRLPSKLKGYGKDKEILEWMLLYENVTELMGSIGEKGYFLAEPLLVVKSTVKKGFYEVVEGNRRLAAVKLLKSPASATVKKNSVAEIVKEAKYAPEELPTIEFDHKDDIVVYLGYRHITGIKEWDALAKAKYLDILRQKLNIRNKAIEHRTLAKIIGTNPSYVKSILSGLRIFQVIEKNNFFDIEDLDEVTVEFGVLYTAAGRSNIAKFVGVNLDEDDPTKSINTRHLKELTSWMFKKNSEGITRLGESRNIKELDKVLANENALKAFRAGTPLAEAVLYTNQPIEVLAKAISRSLDSIKIARTQTHSILEIDDENFINSLDEIIGIANELKILIKSKTRG